MWAGSHPSRSGYLRNPDQMGDEIALKSHDDKSFMESRTVGGRDLSRSGSTSESGDWQFEKGDSRKGAGAASPPGLSGMGITKTVKITQS